MKKITAIHSTLTALSLLACATPALAQVTSGTMADDLEEMASRLGDPNGRLRYVNSTGRTEVLAYKDPTFVVYTAGDAVTEHDTFAFCVEDPLGRLSSCDVVDGSGPFAYICSDWSCACNGAFDCFDMLVNACAFGTLNCDQPAFGPDCVCQPSDW